MSILDKFLRNLPPKQVGYALACWKIFLFDYGYANSLWKGACVDKNNAPIPWYTYPAIEYLKQLNFSKKTIFEYGSGNSSLFWAKKAQKIISIEHNQNWYQKLANQTSFSNLEIKLITEPDLYIKEILNHDSFDVIIIDGCYRYRCAQEAVKKLKAGGLIILDNSDWYIKTAQFLRSANLLEVDLAGFTPLNGYTATTSLFFHREFYCEPENENQPLHGLGALKQYGEEV